MQFNKIETNRLYGRKTEQRKKNTRMTKGNSTTNNESFGETQGKKLVMSSYYIAIETKEMAIIEAEV